MICSDNSETSNNSNLHVLAISGGVGGAKLALGLSHILAPEQLTIVANTGDDFDYLGLSISPDLDTVMYTLANLSNKQQGWGLADETWSCMEALTKLNAESWFQLGDKDMATHIYRTSRLKEGATLTQVTEELCTSMGIEHRIIPMTDDKVSTIVQTRDGELAFQNYFVKEQCKPSVTGFYFQGIEQAKPQKKLLELIQSDQLSSIIICPSNPFVSVDPLLQLKDIKQLIKQQSAPMVAISPIVGGSAIKGPAAKMFTELGLDCNCVGVAKFYGSLLDGFIIDTIDAKYKTAIEEMGIPCLVTQTVMQSLEDRIQLGKDALNFACSL